MDSKLKSPSRAYEPPRLVRYGRVEELTQMPKKDVPPGQDPGSNPGGGGNSGGGYNNKNPGSADGQKSQII